VTAVHRLATGLGEGVHTSKLTYHAGTPAGALTPAFAEQVAVDSETGAAYVAEGTTSADWSAALPSSQLGAVRCSPSLARPFTGTGGLVSTGYVFGPLGVAEVVSSSGLGSSVSLVRESGLCALHFSALPATFDLLLRFFLVIPSAFSGWDTPGVRCFTKLDTGTGGASVTLSVLNPASLPNQFFPVPRAASRSVLGGASAETKYGITDLTAAVLGASPAYIGGDVLGVSISIASLGASATTNSAKVGPIDLLWRG